jgi:hypothetical protein
MKILLRLFVLYLIMCNPVLADRREQTLLEYGTQCAREIGEIPPFDCNSGTNIPITIDGKPPHRDESPNRCDRPSLLHPYQDWPGQCIPYSRILNLSRGNTQISAYCRQEKLRKNAMPHFDEVDIVLHHAGNGKTCWFQSQSSKPGADGIDASRVPPPNEKTPPNGRLSAVEFWKTPADTAKQNCMSCHDSGPYIFSPYIGQVWDQVPTDPWGKYSSIGPALAHPPLLVISTPGNACIGCHRIGSDKSCDVYLPFSTGMSTLSTGERAQGNNQLANSYPLSHWMPVDNNMSHAEWDAANIRSVKALLSCCTDKGRKDPDCKFTPIATGSAPQPRNSK